MNKHGQSMIEYMFIAILIILGIVIMGPYVLRSVNAHFKLWDESVQDSATENLTQAPLNDVPSLPLNCTCHYVSGNCGGPGIGGAGACGANQREYDLDCGTSPQGCSGQPASTCQDDPLCCTVYSPQACGTFPIGTTPLPAGNCYYGQRIYANQCPGFPIECQTDATCNPACMGIVTQGAAACPNGPPANGTPLNQNYGITYVYADNQADCALIPGCTAALCSPPGGTPGTPNCTYCNPAQYCQYYTQPPQSGCKNPPQLFQTPPRAHNGIWVPKDGSLNPDAICKAYGFTNGGYGNLFPYPIQADETTYNAGACHNSVNPQAYFVSTQPTATLSPQILAETSCQTSNDTSNAIFPYTFNGHTAYWAIVNNCDAGNWTYVWCFPNDYSSSNPNSLPDNATVCNYDIAPNDSNPNDNQCGAGKSPNNHPEYYQAVSFCGQNNPDGDSPACTVICNPGYSTWTNTWGSVTLPTGCVKN